MRQYGRTKSTEKMVNIYIYMYMYIYIIFQGEYAIVWENGLCIELHRHNQKYLYMTLNRHGDNGERSLEEYETLHFYLTLTLLTWRIW